MNSIEHQPSTSVSKEGDLTVCPVTDFNKTIEAIYPIGSIYITTQKVTACPLETLGFGKWKKVSDGRVLMGAANPSYAGTTCEAGLPNITGTFGAATFDAGATHRPEWNGAFHRTEEWVALIVNGNGDKQIRPGYFDASRSNPIYGRSNTVQPPGYFVNIFERIS